MLETSFIWVRHTSTCSGSCDAWSGQNRRSLSLQHDLLSSHLACGGMRPRGESGDDTGSAAAAAMRLQHQAEACGEHKGTLLPVKLAERVYRRCQGCCRYGSWACGRQESIHRQKPSQAPDRSRFPNVPQREPAIGARSMQPNVRAFWEFQVGTWYRGFLSQYLVLCSVD